jgi:hypothetical protein
LNHMVNHCGCYLEFMFGIMSRKSDYCVVWLN